MVMRRSDAFITALGVLSVLFALTFEDAGMKIDGARQALARERALVQSLGLTDLCLFTEARYTRHPTQADLHTPFQDHPLALEHFPTGSLVPPQPVYATDADVHPQAEIPD